MKDGGYQGVSPIDPCFLGCLASYGQGGYYIYAKEKNYNRPIFSAIPLLRIKSGLGGRPFNIFAVSSAAITDIS